MARQEKTGLKRPMHQLYSLQTSTYVVKSVMCDLAFLMVIYHSTCDCPYDAVFGVFLGAALLDREGVAPDVTRVQAWTDLTVLELHSCDNVTL